jgi:hypothetical protein
MSSQATATGRRDRFKELMPLVDKAALGLVFTFVIAVLPFTAVGFLARMV